MLPLANATIHIQGESCKIYYASQPSHTKDTTRSLLTHQHPPWNVDRERASPVLPQPQAYRNGRHEEGLREAEGRPSYDFTLYQCKARPHHPRTIPPKPYDRPRLGKISSQCNEALHTCLVLRTIKKDWRKIRLDRQRMLPKRGCAK